MGRPLRMAPGGFVYDVLNRANGRMPLFEKDGDYAAFERVLAESCERIAMRLLAYCVMPNHWHLVLWPRQDGHLSGFMGWLTLTHTQRWHAHHRTVGHGQRAEQWRWGSAWQRVAGASRVPLSEWPVDQPADRVAWANTPQTEAELAALRQSATKGQPFGNSHWIEQMVMLWSLGSTLRFRGRPKKELVRNGS